MRCQKRGGNRLENKGLAQGNSSPTVGRLQIGLESDAVWTGVFCGLDWSRLPSGLRLFCEMAWNNPPYTLFNLQKADKYSNLGRTRTFTERSAKKNVSVRVHPRLKGAECSLQEICVRPCSSEVKRSRVLSARKTVSVRVLPRLKGAECSLQEKPCPSVFIRG